MIKLVLHNVQSGSDHVLTVVNTDRDSFVAKLPAGLPESSYIIRAISVDDPAKILSHTSIFLLSTVAQTSKPKQRSVDEDEEDIDKDGELQYLSEPSYRD